MSNVAANAAPERMELAAQGRAAGRSGTVKPRRPDAGAAPGCWSKVVLSGALDCTGSEPWTQVLGLNLMSGFRVLRPGLGQGRPSTWQPNACRSSSPAARGRLLHQHRGQARLEARALELRGQQVDEQLDLRRLRPGRRQHRVDRHPVDLERREHDLEDAALDLIADLPERREAEADPAGDATWIALVSSVRNRPRTRIASRRPSIRNGQGSSLPSTVRTTQR